MKIICLYFLLFMTYSFFGWCLEVGCKFYTEKRFINRGFLIGPYCPIYGFGFLIMQFFLTRYLKDPFTLFFMSILSFSFLEYITSFLLEKIYHTRWWDYSKRKFNINGRICLETMIPFGFIAMILMYFLNPLLFRFWSSLPDFIIISLAIIIFIIFFIDNVISLKILGNLLKISNETEKKQIIFKDDTERITKLVRKKIETSKKSFDKRLIYAFPNFKVQKRKKTKNK